MNGVDEEDDAESLRRKSDRIERLLGELRGATSPAAWGRIEELVSSMTAIYGHGLERMLEIFARGGKIDAAIRAELCDDPLIESLLLLHGLHPAPTEERVTRAVDRVRDAIGSGGGNIEASPVDPEGAVTVRLRGDWRRCPVHAGAIEAALRRSLEESAPELVQIGFENDGDFPPSSSASPASPTLVQIDLSRSRRARSREVAP
jgi:Fe-S cluster biogenesis protein NfuA